MAGYEEFSDPRLVRLFDTLNGPGADTEFFLSLPRPTDRSVLDVGCGTGLLAVEIARRSLDVTGADPSPMMLDLARNRKDGGLVRWVASDAANLDLPARFDLAVMTSHVFQFFLSDEAALAALTAIRRHMEPDGRLAFEARNPQACAWESWTRDTTIRSISHAALGPVETWVEVDGVREDLVDFTLRYNFADGTTWASHNTLRFVEAEHVLGLLEAAGFRDVTTYGDFDRTQLTATSPEIVVIAEA